MHIIQKDNITIAHTTPLTTTTNKTITTTKNTVQVARGDLLSTSKYYQYHKAMGHTPQHIQQVSDKQKTTPRWEWSSDTHAQTNLSHSCKKKQIHSRCPIASDLLVPSSVRANSGEWPAKCMQELTGVLIVRTSSGWATPCANTHQYLGGVMSKQATSTISSISYLVAVVRCYAINMVGVYMGPCEGELWLSDQNLSWSAVYEGEEWWYLGNDMAIWVPTWVST